MLTGLFEASLPLSPDGSGPITCRRPPSATWMRRPGQELKLTVMRDRAARGSSARSPDLSVLDERVYERGGPRKLLVISSLTYAKAPRGPDVILQWHVSVSRSIRSGPTAPTDEDLLLVRRAFGMVDAEEDNHHPGNARHLWLPVNPARRVGCECKDDEIQVTEPSGYVWSQAVASTVHPRWCRACEIAVLTRRPCPLHGAASGPHVGP